MGHVIRQAFFISGVAAALVLFALRAGDVAANPAHHPGGDAAAAPGAPAMAPGTPMATPAASSGAAAMAPSAPMAAPATSPSVPGAPGAPGMAGGGMGGMMDEMMGKMGPASPGGCMGGDCGPGGATPIYPSLMTLPALTPEKRAGIDVLASQQIKEGMERHAKGAESLERATQVGDHAAMQQSVGTMREGLAQLDAGIAARRVLLEGKAPRNLALDWFKREMNLASPIAPEDSRVLHGVTPFHLFTMALLIAFALAMVVMYFFKMRRTAALFGRLDPGSGPPPPGGAPPLAGGPGPTSPATPPAGGAPPEAPSASPPAAKWRGQLRVGSIVTETPRVKTFRLLPSSDDPHMPFTFVPGQFLNLAFGIGGARMNRSYSISSSPMQRGYVDLTVQREPRGAVSRHTNDLLRVGSRIEAGGPVGKFTFTGAEADSVVLIAGGVGITPLMSIMRYLTEQSWAGDIFFVYSCRTLADFVFANEIAVLQRVNPKLHVAVTVEHPEGTDWKGAQGRITKALLTQAVPELASRRIHLCGPAPMMDAIKTILTELGVPSEQVKTESFGAARPIPGAAGTSVKTTAPATGPLVTFSKNSKSAKIHVDQTILELSEELDIGIEFACRVGTCGICKVKMTSGEVEMAVEEALEPDDKADGIILACQAKPKSAVTVEA